jgi:hypothetical protein
MTHAALALTLSLIATSSLAADAAERKFIRAGMAEAEVLVKIGKPDHESVTSGGGARVAEKTWTYLPHSRDPQTLTVVTIQAGKVSAVDRTVSR